MRDTAGLMLSLIFALVLALHGGPLGASALGPFQKQADIGAPRHAGQAEWVGDHFIVTAGGSNMMASHDEFHFVWRRVTGDFDLKARVLFTGPGAEDHRKAGLMARSSLRDSSAYVDVAVHGNGPKALQVRRTDGGLTDMLMAVAADGEVNLPGPSRQAAAPPVARAGAVPSAKLVELQRHGDRFTISVSEPGQPVVRRELADASLPRTLLVGLYLCAHSPDAIESARFDEVSLARRE